MIELATCSYCVESVKSVERLAVRTYGEVFGLCAGKSVQLYSLGSEPNHLACQTLCLRFNLSVTQHRCKHHRNDHREDLPRRPVAGGNRQAAARQTANRQRNQGKTRQRQTKAKPGQKPLVSDIMSYKTVCLIFRTHFSSICVDWFIVWSLAFWQGMSNQADSGPVRPPHLHRRDRDAVIEFTTPRDSNPDSWTGVISGFQGSRFSG
jgi:hypothetical protein